MSPCKSAKSKTPEPPKPSQRPNLRPTTVQQTPIRFKVNKKAARRKSDSKLLRVKPSAKFTPLNPQSEPQQSVFDRLFTSGKTYRKHKSPTEEEAQAQETSVGQEDVQTIWTNSVKKTESYLDRHLKSKERHVQKRPQSLKLPLFSTFVKTESEQPRKPCTAFAGGDDNAQRSSSSGGTTSKTVIHKSPPKSVGCTSSKTSLASSFTSPLNEVKPKPVVGSAQLPDFLSYSDSDTTLSPDGPDDSSDDTEPVQNHHFKFPKRQKSNDGGEPLMMSEDLEMNRYISNSALVKEQEGRILKSLVEQTLLRGSAEGSEEKKMDNLPRILSEAILTVRDGEKLEGLVRLTNLYDHAVTFRIIPPRPMYKVDPPTGTLGIGRTTSVKLKTDYLSSRLLMSHDTFEIQSTRIQPGHVSVEELDRFWRDVGPESIETTWTHLILMPHPDQRVDEFRQEQKNEEANFKDPSQKLISLKAAGGENSVEFGSSTAWTMGNDETCLLIQSLLGADGKLREKEEGEGNGRESLETKEEDGVNQGKGCSNSLVERKQDRVRAKLKASLVFSTGLTVCLISFLYGMHRCSNKN